MHHPLRLPTLAAGSIVPRPLAPAVLAAAPIAPALAITPPPAALAAPPVEAASAEVPGAALVALPAAAAVVSAENDNSKKRMVNMSPSAFCARSEIFAPRC